MVAEKKKTKKKATAEGTHAPATNSKATPKKTSKKKTTATATSPDKDGNIEAAWGDNKILSNRYHKLAISRRGLLMAQGADEKEVSTRIGLRNAHSKIAKSQTKWMNVLYPASTMKDVLQTQITDIPEPLFQGIPVMKITTQGQYKQRIVTISRDKLALFCTHSKINQAKGAYAAVASKLPIPMWTPSKGFGLSSSTSLRDRYVRYMDLADIEFVQTGVVGTMTLENARSKGSGGALLDGRLKQQIVIIYFRGGQTLNFVIENDQHRNALVKALNDMKRVHDSVQQWIGNDALLIRYVWYDVDCDRNGRISSAEFARNICPRINLHVKNVHYEYKAFVQQLQKKDPSRTDSKELTYGECMALLQSMKPKLPSMELWDSLFGSDKNEINAQDLLSKFLSKTQGEGDTTLDDTEALLLCLQSLRLDEDADDDEVTSDANAEPTLSRTRFISFLHSEFNDAFDPEQQEWPNQKQMMDQPMSHYWINTSHNTYLTGDQLRSRSSVEAYVKSLYRGCKCLELDCWDGEDPPAASADNEDAYVPVVFHGHTLTSKIQFKHIIQAVDNYLTSHRDTYPIILSLENHCSHPYQRSMAKIMTSILGKKLYIPSKKQAQEDDLPSPESLRGMAIIKGKRPPEEEEEDKEGNAGNDDESEEDDPYDEALTPDGADGKNNSKPAKPSKIVPELAKLTLFHGTKHKSFEKSMAQAPGHMHSIGESKITKLISKQKDNAELWRQYNVRHMTRTYPAGARVDSSNYNPTLAWAMGCQLVALNFQTGDVPLIINDGRFRQHGNCGYILKPERMRSTGKQKGSLGKMNLTVRVLSGNCLPKPKGEKEGETVDPYVTVVLHDVQDGGKEEYVSTSHTTSCVNDNGFCPVWNDPGKTFTVHTPDVATLVFTVIDDDVVGDDKIAAAAIPITCLRQGYRSIQLYDYHSNTRHGPFQYATLLVEIKF